VSEGPIQRPSARLESGRCRVAPSGHRASHRTGGRADHRASARERRVDPTPATEAQTLQPRPAWPPSAGERAFPSRSPDRAPVDPDTGLRAVVPRCAGPADDGDRLQAAGRPDRRHRRPRAVHGYRQPHDQPAQAEARDVPAAPWPLRRADLIADLLDFMRTAPPAQAPRAVILDVDIAEPASDGADGVARSSYRARRLGRVEDGAAATHLARVVSSRQHRPGLAAAILPDTTYDDVASRPPTYSGSRQASSATRTARSASWCPISACSPAPA